MERPDVDGIERFTKSYDIQALCAYVRELEAGVLVPIDNVITNYEAMSKDLVIARARITELEAALTPFVQVFPQHGQRFHDEARRVLRANT